MNWKTTFKKQNSLFSKIIFCNLKFSFGIAFFFLGFEAHSQYCEPTLDCTDDDTILNVTLSTLTNPSTCGSGGYNDFTALSAPTLNMGSSYPISVTVGDGWSNESVSVWIDYNENGTFDASEFTYIGTGSGNVVTGNITIQTTTAGTKRMRVRVAAVGAAAATSDMACDEESEYGETEDYSVNIQPSLSVHDSNIAKKLIVFKSNNLLNINSETSLIKQVELYDLTGKLIYQETDINKSSSNLSTSHFGNQILILKVTTTDQITHIKKIAN